MARKASVKKHSWGGSRTKGKKRPFREEEVQLIRASLKAAKELLQLALFETAISTCLRSSDLLELRWDQLISAPLGSPPGIAARIDVKQQKTGRVVPVVLGERAREALWAYKLWLDENETALPGRAFRLNRDQYAVLVKSWAKIAHLDPRYYSTHSMRRTRPSHVFSRTRNVKVAAELLGHTDMSHTGAYLGLDTEDALRIAEEHDL
jgi:integrase